MQCTLMYEKFNKFPPEGKNFHLSPQHCRTGRGAHPHHTCPHWLSRCDLLQAWCCPPVHLASEPHSDQRVLREYENAHCQSPTQHCKLYRIIHKSMKHLKNSQQINYTRIPNFITLKYR
jgi:hypothetical protein